MIPSIFSAPVMNLENSLKAKKVFLMEPFYRAMQKKHQVLMSGNDPMTGQWNYDEENRIY
jgi:deoxyribodipyrimidine photolyase-related protein